VAKFDHLSRRQLGEIHPDRARAVDLAGLANRFRHKRDHTRLVHGRASRSDVAMDEDMVMLQRGATDEQVAGADLIEDDLSEVAWCAGHLGVDSRDFTGDLALLVGREATFQSCAGIGRHMAPIAMRVVAVAINAQSGA
jgi:hypothetical protein